MQKQCSKQCLLHYDTIYNAMQTQFTSHFFCFSTMARVWDKVFKSGPCKFRGRQPLKNLLRPLLNTLSHLKIKNTLNATINTH